MKNIIREVDRNLYSHAFKHVIGKKIKEVRRLLPEELDAFGWTKSPMVFELDNGTVIIPMTDDEANDGGASIQYNYRNDLTKTFYTINENEL